MGEYVKIIPVATIAAALFLGGFRGPYIDTLPWLGPIYLVIKIFILLFGMIWVRATFPRIRYDRLMAFGWKILLPLSLVLIFITATGILLAQQINSWLLWSIPILSLAAGMITIAL